MNKKKFFKIISLSLCIALIIVAVVACDGKDPLITGVSLKSQPDKTEYYIGEELVLDGAVLSVTYDDGSVADIDVVEDMVTGYDKTITGTQILTVTYSEGGIEKSASMIVTVREVEIPVTLERIEIKSLPHKTEYYVGEELVLDGAAITAYYSNTSTKDAEVTREMISGYESSREGQQNVTVTYEDDGVTKDAYFGVTVKPYFKVHNGSILRVDGGYSSIGTDALCTVTDGVFSEGRLSAKVTVKPNGDNGIVFGVGSNKDKFWENGAGYYFFFITSGGGAYLGKVDNGIWSALSYTAIDGFDFSVEHELAVVKYDVDDTYTVIQCYVDGKSYAFVRDYEALEGVGYGIRAGGTDIVYGEISISDETGEKEELLEGVNVRNGNFVADGEKLLASENNSLLSFSDKSFAYGIYSVKMKKNGNGDDGIVFGLSENGVRSYWENGVSYYFFFISRHGTAYLGKANDGAWTALGVSSRIDDYDETGEYTLKVIRTEASIACYVDDVLYVNYNDSMPLLGTATGLRAGCADTEYSEIEVEESGAFEFVSPADFGISSGEFNQIGSIIMSVKDKSLMIYDSPLNNGTVTVKMSPGSNTNNGIVIRAAAASDSFYEKEDGTSYYFFHISTNKTARLLRFDGKKTSICEEVSLSAGYSSGAESELKVVFNDGNIKGYVDGALFVDYTDDNPLAGDGVGVRTSASGVIIRDFEISENTAPLSADMVIFGHSHVEYWRSYKEDLASVGTVANLGVGGSAAIHWVDRVKHIVAYNPEYVVMWLGSNDLVANVDENTIIQRLSSILTGISTALPDAKIIILNEFYQPGGGRETEEYRAKIRSLNARFVSEFSSKYVICDVFDAALKDGVVDASLFVDVFHLKTPSYAPIRDKLLAIIAEMD